MQEVLALSKVQHKNIVQCYGLWRADDGVVHMVLEYCSGGSLETLVKQQGPLSLKSTITFALQVCVNCVGGGVV